MIQQAIVLTHAQARRRFIQDGYLMSNRSTAVQIRNEVLAAKQKRFINDYKRLMNWKPSVKAYFRSA